MSRAPLNTFEDRLWSLFKKRRSFVVKGRRVFTATEEGAELYVDALNEICKTISIIKQNFPNKVSQCDLFSRIEDPAWSLEFKKNFYKIFIDRAYCEDRGFESWRQFNKVSFDENSRGADLCYSEAFAVGFLAMLREVERQFKSEEFEISEKRILRLLTHFNKIVTGSDGNIIHHGRIFGAKATYQDIQKRKESQNKFGQNSIYYDFASCRFVTELDKDFDHAQSISEYYGSYLEDLKIGLDGQESVFKMSALIPSCAHLCADGNARSANLLGWMEAILHNANFPIAINPYFITKEIVDEAKEWTRDFMTSPAETKSIPESSQGLYESVSMQNYSSDGIDELLGIFLSDLFEKSDESMDIFFEIPFVFDKVLFVGLSSSVSETFIATSDQSRLSGKRQSFDLRDLAKIIEAHKEEVIAEKDAGERNSKIALFFLRHVVEKLSEYNSEEKGNFLRLVVKNYKPENFKDEAMREEYAALCARCNLGKIKPKEFKALAASKSAELD